VGWIEMRDDTNTFSNKKKIIGARRDIGILLLLYAYL